MPTGNLLLGNPVGQYKAFSIGQRLPAPIDDNPFIHLFEIHMGTDPLSVFTNIRILDTPNTKDCYVCNVVTSTSREIKVIIRRIRPFDTDNTPVAIWLDILVFE